ncbi:cytochrome c-type biogenesis protein CcmH [Marchantia polymorpha subsp. ruderalis]|uniref:Cytochrome c-type biogenesis protein n=2 Tax=Marchantia polymorpha TaxID=3197 RepID=A0A176VY29_MARPO|nr:hypothetical protein AXG93_4368s1740 [Marchantia polymorpha subsp. ruderalis]PTQ41684.1 hypothetical protein MARPO_0033s0089 [Marchantia polymorpha]PTQ41685.1 hypothetical protein MARPO_0033s0089 [Marchantia polymorpha]PTQ41686.1 hypothetical protein MARPO_0033s0089 [Marchantia polymorpha]BBM98720.1 hypothetical protein Mp_1g15720 [Marchantia polymorpha subsp. ruderalis]|eukprot:PTQ41684.1 hypothetical protein MARPO_0033s0089 [Marchantia polymorpha]
MAEEGPESDGSNRTKFEQRVRSAQIEARARNISHNVRCLECGHQAIEESQAEIAIKLRKVIRDELSKGKSDKEIYHKLTTEYGETILYNPQFDAQSAVLWLLPVVTVGVVAGFTLYRGRRQSADVGELTRSLFHGIPLSAAEHNTLSAIVKPPHAAHSASGLAWVRGLLSR